MDKRWWNRMIDSVADRGRELVSLSSTGSVESRLKEMCDALLSGVGEARGTALAREVVRALEALNDTQWDWFLTMLHNDLGPDAAGLMKSVEAYQKQPGMDNLLALREQVEPPRQELFRRINLSPGGIHILVKLRERLLKSLKKHPHLKAVDADLKHLFTSWFNRGFLELESISWNSSAMILEKLIHYDLVQPIRNLKDLRRRLEADRRCYAFFHPALPDEPLIFVEVALICGIPQVVNRLLDPQAPVLPIHKADSAIFYSINNCQFGLRGISFGNFLIKQVTTELAEELPSLKNFATFSPLPQFAQTLKRTDDGAPFTPSRLRALLAEESDVILKQSGKTDVVEGFYALLADPKKTHQFLSGAIETLALAYLVLVRRGNVVTDPVAFFHLSNGARLERINPQGDLSEERWRDSFGVMVNYLYELDKVERNHEGFVNDGEVALSKPLAKKLRPIRTAWQKA